MNDKKPLTRAEISAVADELEADVSRSYEAIAIARSKGEPSPKALEAHNQLVRRYQATRAELER